MQMSQCFINKSIDEWHQRLQAVVQNNGAYNFRRHWYNRSMSLVRNWHDNVNTINWIMLTLSSVCAHQPGLLWLCFVAAFFYELSFCKVV